VVGEAQVVVHSGVCHSGTSQPTQTRMPKPKGMTPIYVVLVSPVASSAG
jgi:hypothetical protein